jgi:hypothetical protein
MPISSDDFEKSDRAPEVLLVDFFRSNPRVAYKMDELIEILASMGRNLTREEMERILVYLEYGRKIESKKIAGETYYRYHEFSFFKPPIKPR